MRRAYAFSPAQGGLDLGQETPSMPVLDRARCHSRPISHLTAARLVETYHYAHRVPSIVAAIGMYVDDVLAGCVTYGIPPNRNVLACCGEELIPHALELNRLFLHDWAGRNSESWLIAQSFRWLADRWPEYRILVSYADTGHGHRGGIYQATNWVYTGPAERCGVSSQEQIIDGERLHAKAVFNRFGTKRPDTLRQMGFQVEHLEQTVKHRYVHFLGDRRQQRALRAALRWPALPYPKGEVV